MNLDSRELEARPVVAPAEYHAPAVEAVVTLDELEREVHYAGVGASNAAA